MARNEEKAMGLFNKWTTFRKDFHAASYSSPITSETSNRRPLLASDCQTLPEAEKWRRELVRDFTKKIAAIQNATLGEHRIRELNDELNKISRQKHYWDIRIRELGGGDTRGRSQFYDVEGKELPGAPGYKYYGAAKELPGVRELFAEQDDKIEEKRQKRSRGDLYKNITPDYYGYRDDDDGILKPKEAEREAFLLAQAEEEYKEKRRTMSINNNLQLEVEEDEDIDIALLLDSTTMAPMMQLHANTAASDVTLRAHVEVPSQVDIEAEVIERKRLALLEKYS